MNDTVGIGTEGARDEAAVIDGPSSSMSRSTKVLTNHHGEGVQSGNAFLGALCTLLSSEHSESLRVVHTDQVENRCGSTTHATPIILEFKLVEVFAQIRIPSGYKGRLREATNMTSYSERQPHRWVRPSRVGPIGCLPLICFFAVCPEPVITLSSSTASIVRTLVI